MVSLISVHGRGSLFDVNGLLHIPIDAVLCQFDYRTLQVRFYLNIEKAFTILSNLYHCSMMLYVL